MTQAELDLARLGMTIARLQLKVMVAVNAAMEFDGQSSCEFYEAQMAKLCDRISKGEIRGSDAAET